jgi:hypothetical protein
MPSEAARLVATAAWKPASASAAGSMAPPGPAGGRKSRLAVITATEGSRDAATELLADAPRLTVAEAEGVPVRDGEACDFVAVGDREDAAVTVVVGVGVVVLVCDDVGVGVLVGDAGGGGGGAGTDGATQLRAEEL